MANIMRYCTNTIFTKWWYHNLRLETKSSQNVYWDYREECTLARIQKFKTLRAHKSSTSISWHMLLGSQLLRRRVCNAISGVIYSIIGVPLIKTI